MQSFRLAHDERAELRALARAARVSVSDYLRSLVRVHVARAAKRSPPPRVPPRKVEFVE